MFVCLGVSRMTAILLIQRSFTHMCTCFSNRSILLSNGLLLDRCACEVEGRGVQGIQGPALVTIMKSWRTKDTLEIVKES
jgi:hypothetical protein